MTGLVLTDENIDDFLSTDTGKSVLATAMAAYFDTPEGEAKILGFMSQYDPSSSGFFEGYFATAGGKAKMEEIFQENLQSEKQRMSDDAYLLDDLTLPEKIQLTYEMLWNSGQINYQGKQFNEDAISTFLAIYSPSLLSKFFYVDEYESRTNVIKHFEKKYGRFYDVSPKELREYAQENNIPYPKWILVNKVGRGKYKIPLVMSRYRCKELLANMAVVADKDCGDLNDQLSGLSARVIQNAKSIKATFQWFSMTAINDCINIFTMYNGIYEKIYAAAEAAVIQLFNMLADLLDPALWEGFIYQLIMDLVKSAEGILMAIIDTVKSAIATAEGIVNGITGLPQNVADSLKKSLADSKAQADSIIKKQANIHACKTSSFIIKK